MKAIDIATKNHISIEDVIEVCRELEIPCTDESSDISDKDIFLIEKKIEAIKKKKADKIEQMKKGKKIKLKRKVHVAKEIIDKKGADTHEDKGRERPAGEKPPARGTAGSRDAGKTGKTEGVRPSAGRRTDGDRRRQGPAGRGGRPERPGREKKTDEKGQAIVSDSGAHEGKDSKKRKKDKEKDKEKKKYKKEQEEKEILLKKKNQEYKKKEFSAPERINMTESISVGELAKKLNVKANEVIAKLMKLGVMATINQVIDSDTVEILASEYGTEVNVVSLFDETVIRQEEVDKTEDYTFRPPVVTVMGHVDHGKTKLLDAIRETDVTSEEFGGITQHIGAYMVTLGDKKITFLDTPGHAAFTTMRARGASITDIVVLVVAANDGVMPQTIEAIDHARDAGVPIIVAINKIDLQDANIQKVKQELSNYELIPEEWGGTTLFAEISAKQKINIQELLELIVIQAEMLELKANPSLMAKGTVIEARLDPGRGSVSTILIQNGTLRIGDPFVVGVFNGKVRAMNDDRGAPLIEAGPSAPVEVVGIAGVPGAGDPFEGVESEKFAKQISQKRLEYRRIESAKKFRKVTLESLNEMIKEGEMHELRIIVKADVDGSAQALTESLEKLSTSDIRVKVIHVGTGGINDSDVMLASASNAIIIGYHVRPTGKVSDLAAKENVSIKFYNIIFEVTDDIKAAMEGMLSPDLKEEITASGEIKQIFKISKVGTIAGALLNAGKVEKSSKMRLIREGIVIYDGVLKSLKRYKDDVSVVEAGQEFGFGLFGFNDIKEGDNFEAYRIHEIAKKLE